MSGKRSYSQYKAQRTMASGRVLRYNPTVPVAGSSRAAANNTGLRRFKRAAGMTPKQVSNLRIGGFLGIELKYVDYALVAQAVLAPTDAAGAEMDPATALALNAIAQGDGEQQRDGKQVAVKSCYVTGVVDCPALINQTTAKNIPTIYIALVLDKQTNAAQAASELVFTNPGASAITAASPLRNMQYTSRFEVLDSVCLEIEQPQATYDGTNLEQAGSRTPFKLSWTGDLMTQYVATGATVASIQDNSLHVIAYAGPDLTAAPVLSYNSRVRFVG